jgi:hypothetical protein
MKAGLELDLRHSGNLGAGRREMTIDPSAMPRLMGALTDLYSDKENATIREVSANAWDSHKKAGQTRPVEVTLPTAMDPVFTVQDWGTGMSPEVALEKFSQYGWSSKAEENLEGGMFGLGCKAPLTYTAEFALTIVHDGIKFFLDVNRGANGIGGCEIVEDDDGVKLHPTDEPNGVTVVIPVKNAHLFAEKAREHYRYWKPGEVLVDGEPPAPLEGDWLDPDVLLIDTYGSNHDVVVMGSVPYPVKKVTNAQSITTKYNYSAVVWVDVGQVDPVPARESLHMTPRTLETLQTAAKFVTERMSIKAQENVEAAPDGTEAMRRASKWRQIAGVLGLHYRGRPVPSTIWFPEEKWYWEMWENRAITASNAVFRPGGSHYADKLAIIHGHPTKSFTPVQRKKSHSFMKDYWDSRNVNGARPRSYWVLGDIEPYRPWVDGVHLFDWNDIDKVPLEKVKSSVPNYTLLKKSKYYYGIDNYDTEDLPVDKPLVLLGPGLLKELPTGDLIPLVEHYHIMLVHPRSHEKMLRENPEMLSMQRAIERRLKVLVASVPSYALTLDTSYKMERVVRALNPRKVKDLRLRQAISVSRMAGHVQEEVRSLERLWRKVTLTFDAPTTHRKPPGNSASIIDEYPLLECLQPSANPESIYEYVNTLYAAKVAANPTSYKESGL